MFYRSFGSKNAIVTFIFDLTRGIDYVKPNEVKTQNSKKSKPYLYCPFLPLNSINVIYFHLRQLEMPKRRSQILPSIILSFFSAIAEPKIKIILWFLRLILTYDYTTQTGFGISSFFMSGFYMFCHTQFHLFWRERKSQRGAQSSKLNNMHFSNMSPERVWSL